MKRWIVLGSLITLAGCGSSGESDLKPIQNASISSTAANLSKDQRAALSEATIDNSLSLKKAGKNSKSSSAAPTGLLGLIAATKQLQAKQNINEPESCEVSGTRLTKGNIDLNLSADMEAGIGTFYGRGNMVMSHKDCVDEDGEVQGDIPVTISFSGQVWGNEKEMTDLNLNLLLGMETENIPVKIENTVHNVKLNKGFTIGLSINKLWIDSFEKAGETSTKNTEITMLTMLRDRMVCGGTMDVDGIEVDCQSGLALAFQEEIDRLSKKSSL